MYISLSLSLSFSQLVDGARGMWARLETIKDVLDTKFQQCFPSVVPPEEHRTFVPPASASPSSAASSASSSSAPSASPKLMSMDQSKQQNSQNSNQNNPNNVQLQDCSAGLYTEEYTSLLDANVRVTRLAAHATADMARALLSDMRETVARGASEVRNTTVDEVTKAQVSAWLLWQ